MVVLDELVEGFHVLYVDVPPCPDLILTEVVCRWGQREGSGCPLVKPHLLERVRDLGIQALAPALWHSEVEHLVTFSPQLPACLAPVACASPVLAAPVPCTGDW